MARMRDEHDTELRALAQEAGIDFYDWRQEHPLATAVIGGKNFQERDFTQLRAELQQMITDAQAPAPAAAVDAPAPGPLATPRQVDYIADLLAERARTGQGGGYTSVTRLYTEAGMIDLPAVAALSRAEASQVIDSLRDNY